MDSTAPFSNKVEEKLVRPTRNTGKIFSLQEKAHFVVLLRSCIPGHTLLLRCPQKAEAPRDIGICRCMDLVQTNKCSFLIMGPHIFQIKLN